jgi:hypothetical protein
MMTMLQRQERAIDRAVNLRALLDDLPSRIDVAVYRAVREEGVPVTVLAARLGLSRQRVYQMVNAGGDRPT